jgi:hypothetical protein
MSSPRSGSPKRCCLHDLRLSGDGLYYWDGRQWVSTLSHDGRSRWNGTAWVPVAAASAPPMYYYRQPVPARVATSWTKPLQYAVAGWYGLQAVYAATLPFWMSGPLTQYMNQAMQRSQQLNPNAPPLPTDFASTMATFMSGALIAGAVIGVAISVVVIIGALMRWTWLFYVVLVLLGFSTLSLPVNLISAVVGSSMLTAFGLPSWLTWLSVAVGIPNAALFIWMLIAVFRHGPWGMRRPIA